ncbi:hypothetical protein [Mesorhizobium sp. 10J20-29]|jgi:hypothetical protein|nr:hypothetical protein [Alphaproteobacteria bacterium]
MNAGEEKAARTHKASRQIMDAETVSREKKTARLRALRLEKEEAEQAAIAAAPPVAKKPARKKKVAAT